ncbi:MAG: FAD:protein FMN transferase [Candidatus Aminicenantaceae bacterium]
MAKKTLLSFFIPFLLLLGCRTKEKWNTATLLYFDTICEINIYCLPQHFQSCQKELNRVFSKIETSFSPDSKDYSSPLVLELFSKAYQVYQVSYGFFDITVAPLSRLWGFTDKNYRLPRPSEIEKKLESVGMEKIRIENDCLILPLNMELDWGGIAKGLGVDLASEALKNMGISRGFINAGGDLYCWGENPSSSPWKVGVKHPRKEGFLGIISISNLGAATTGDYQRFFKHKNVRYHHVFNPHTGYPARNKQTVVVIGPETLYCDALSTALFASPQPERILEKYPDYGAIIVDSQGNIYKLGRTYPFKQL